MRGAAVRATVAGMEPTGSTAYDLPIDHAEAAHGSVSTLIDELHRLRSTARLAVARAEEVEAELRRQMAPEVEYVTRTGVRCVRCDDQRVRHVRRDLIDQLEDKLPRQLRPRRWIDQVERAKYPTPDQIERAVTALMRSGLTAHDLIDVEHRPGKIDTIGPS